MSAIVADSKTIFELRNYFLQEKYMASNLTWSKIISFSMAPVFITENMSCILAMLVASLEIFAIKKSLSAYSRIFISAILFSFISILNNRAINNMKRIWAKDNSCGTPIFTSF